MTPLSHAIADLDRVLGHPDQSDHPQPPALVPILSAIEQAGPEQALRIAKHTYAALAEAGMDSEALVIDRASPMAILAITISLLEEHQGRPNAARRWAQTAAAVLVHRLFPGKLSK